MYAYAGMIPVAFGHMEFFTACSLYIVLFIRNLKQRIRVFLMKYPRHLMLAKKILNILEPGAGK